MSRQISLVPASEYDALAEIVRYLISESIEPLENLLSRVENDLGTDATKWLRRIIDGEDAQSLFQNQG